MSSRLFCMRNQKLFDAVFSNVSVSRLHGRFGKFGRLFDTLGRYLVGLVGFLYTFGSFLIRLVGF